MLRIETKKTNISKMSFDEICMQAICYTSVSLILLVTIVPLLYVISMSVTSQAEIIQNGGRYVLFPKQISFTAYTWLLDGGWMWQALGVSLLRSAVGAVSMLFLTAMSAYTLSRKGLPGRRFFLLIVLITILFGGGLIPNYLLIVGLNLKNNILVYIIPALIDSWGLLIIKQNMEQMPISLDEAARLDGGNDWQIFYRIVLPLNIPVLAVIGLFGAIGHWNSWFDAMIYMDNTKLWPFQLVLRNVLTGVLAMQDISKYQMSSHALSMAAQVNGDSLKMAAVIVGTVPILCIYPFLQKYFTKGMLTGSIKG